KLPLAGAPYIFGFATAYVPWVLLSSSITSSAGSIVEHRYLVKRVIFPVEIIPADSILVHSLPHAILVTLITIACLVRGYASFPELLFVLYYYVCAVVFASSVGLFLASLTVVLRDAQQILPSFLNVWFWLTPIAWGVGQLPPAGRTLVALNPASYIVSGYRYALMPKVFPAPGVFAAVVFWIMAIMMLIIGSFCFRRLQPHFWDCL
ncbi:MAG TPA: ABC transporter permease, partial [Thermoanaerobaculia bacterium]|nr:ABC transporter permease [Thermoanaerobaculia bacterium]